MMCPDNYDRWRERQLQQDREDEHREKCDYCGEPIYDRYYEVFDKFVCETCMDGCVRYAD